MNNKIIYLKHLITRILLSIIILLSIGIFIKIDYKNINYINKYLLEDSIKFTKINKYLSNKFGSIIPKVSNNTTLVFSSSDLLKNEYEEYEDGIKVYTGKNIPISLLSSGIVIYIGDKDNYGNTVIIQGDDGDYYYYGNLDNICINLYDYLDKDTIIGESSDDYIYLVFKKDNKYLKYEEYIKNN